MTKIAICAMAAVVTGLSFSAANAAPKWQQRGFHHGSHTDTGWHHGWRRHHGSCLGGRRAGYWGGQAMLIEPARDRYCFIEKARHHDR